MAFLTQDHRKTKQKKRLELSTPDGKHRYFWLQTCMELFITADPGWLSRGDSLGLQPHLVSVHKGNVLPFTQPRQAAYRAMRDQTPGKMEKWAAAGLAECWDSDQGGDNQEVQGICKALQTGKALLVCDRNDLTRAKT